VSGRLTGHVAIGTGGARGNSPACAGWLTAQCAWHEGLDIAEGSGTVVELDAAGPKGVPFVADVTDCDQVAAVMAEVEAALGAAGVFVNSAGIYHNRPIDGISIAGARPILEVDSGSIFCSAQATMPACRDCGPDRDRC
jgi:NAD(P)-dependent dehydrogenase (short-subunit alcohol dehydrogenase family)